MNANIIRSKLGFWDGHNWCADKHEAMPLPTMTSSRIAARNVSFKFKNLRCEVQDLRNDSVLFVFFNGDLTERYFTQLVFDI